jgi:hypothetical protein
MKKTVALKRAEAEPAQGWYWEDRGATFKFLTSAF